MDAPLKEVKIEEIDSYLESSNDRMELFDDDEIKKEEPCDYDFDEYHSMVGFGKEDEDTPWTGIPAEENQMERFGFPLSHFRESRNTEYQVIGGRSKRPLYTVSGFRFKNLTQTSSTLEEVMVSTINDFIKENIDSIDVKKKNVTLVLHHEKLRDAEQSLFINLNSIGNPGKTVLSFFERFSQSNESLRIQDRMDIDFWIS